MRMIANHVTVSQPSPGSNPGLSARTRPRAGFFRIGAALAFLCLPSCATRTLTVETEPPGALVYLDAKELGRTPLTVPFAHGGVRELLVLHDEGVMRDGERVTFEPVRLRREIGSWAFDVFPFDVFTSLSPVPLHDEEHVRVELTPTRDLDLLRVDQAAFSEALLDRAAGTRERSRVALEEGWPETPPLAPEPERTDTTTPALPRGVAESAGP